MNNFFNSLSDRSFGEPTTAIRPRLDFRFEPAASTIENEPAGFEAGVQTDAGGQTSPPIVISSPPISNHSTFNTIHETSIHPVEKHVANVPVIDKEPPGSSLHDFSVESRLKQIESSIDQFGSKEPNDIPFERPDQTTKVEAPRLRVDEAQADVNVEPKSGAPELAPPQLVQEIHSPSTNNFFTSKNTTEQNVFNSRIEVAEFHQRQNVIAREQHHHSHFGGEINQQFFNVEKSSKATIRDSEKPRAEAPASPIVTVEKPQDPKLDKSRSTAKVHTLAPPQIKVTQVGVQSKNQANSTVNVSIGQIEIRRPKTASSPVIPQRQPSLPVSRIMSLDDYLNRDGGLK